MVLEIRTLIIKKAVSDNNSKTIISSRFDNILYRMYINLIFVLNFLNFYNFLVF